MYRVLQCHSIVPCRDRWPSWLFFRPPWTGYCYMLLWRGTHSSSFLNSHHTRFPAQTGSCSLQLQRNSLYQTLEFVKVMIYFNFKVDTKKTRKWWAHTFTFSGIVLPIVDACCFPTRHGFGFGVIAQDEAYVTLIVKLGGDGGVLVSVG